MRPGAHYHIGGLKVDRDGRTNVPGLWAIGECASTGLHGANRMGSNSLLEGLVLGERAGAAAARAVMDGPASSLDHVARSDEERREALVELNLEDLTYSLKSMMWRQMGLERSGPALDETLERVLGRAVAALPLETPRA